MRFAPTTATWSHCERQAMAANAARWGGALRIDYTPGAALHVHTWRYRQPALHIGEGQRLTAWAPRGATAAQALVGRADTSGGAHVASPFCVAVHVDAAPHAPAALAVRVPYGGGSSGGGTDLVPLPVSLVRAPPAAPPDGSAVLTQHVVRSGWTP
jgi:hypothetical protein